MKLKRVVPVIVIIVIAASLFAAGFALLQSEAFSRFYLNFCAGNTLARMNLELSVGSSGKPDLKFLNNALAGFDQSAGDELGRAAAAELISNVKLLGETLDEGNIERVGRREKTVGGLTKKYAVYKLVVPKDIFIQASDKLSFDALSACLKNRLTRSVEEKLAGLMPLPLSQDAIHKMAAAAVDVVFPKLSSADVAEKIMHDVELSFYTRFGFVYAVEGYMESLAGVFKDVSFSLQLGDGRLSPLCAKMSASAGCSVGDRTLQLSASENMSLSKTKKAKLNASAVYDGKNLLSADADAVYAGGRKFSVGAEVSALDYSRDYNFTGEIKNSVLTLYGEDGKVFREIKLK